MARVRYTVRLYFRCWLPALRSTSFIGCFRYNACRHAASTSMYAQVRHPWRTRPVRVIPKGRTCAAGSQYFASLCLSATFDTTLAGTQQVHPCMLNCAILGAQACTRYTERPNLRCWLSALRSTLFICHFRYNACRHAASTSMYAQLRHPWRTGLYTLYRKAELSLLPLFTSQHFVYLPLSIQRLQARSKYIHVCSGAPSLAHKACTRYTERPSLRFWLSALRSTLFICHFRYNACRHAASTSMYAQVRHPWRTRPVRVIPKGRTYAAGSRLPAPGSRLSALGSQLRTPSPQFSKQ